MRNKMIKVRKCESAHSECQQGKHAAATHAMFLLVNGIVSEEHECRMTRTLETVPVLQGASMSRVLVGPSVFRLIDPASPWMSARFFIFFARSSKRRVSQLRVAF